MTDVQVNPGGRLQHNDAQQTGWYPPDSPPCHFRAAIIFTIDNLEDHSGPRTLIGAVRARSAILTRVEMRFNLAKKLRIVSYAVDVLTRLLKWGARRRNKTLSWFKLSIWAGSRKTHGYFDIEEIQSLIMISCHLFFRSLYTLKLKHN